MREIEIEAAARELPQLVQRARSGEEIVLADRGEAVIRLVPLAGPAKPRGPRQLGR